MRVLELFSGIGAMHLSLEKAGVEVEVCAVEINTVANKVYQQNFPSSKLLPKNILSLNAEKLNKFAPEMIVMSPPCQPFTRVGLKKDMSDVRTDPLKHILTILPDLPSLNYILVENVKGFECSEARNALVKCLEDISFKLQEFLISPCQINVPNMRTRYFLLGKRLPLAFGFTTTGITNKLPEEGINILESLFHNFPITNSVSDILETNDINNDKYQEYLVPDNLLEKRIWVMDIVTQESTTTCCFTKAYGHYVEGTGSIYCPFDQDTVTKVLANQTRSSFNLEDIRSLHLRYFTPREVARLMSFPDGRFLFPAETTRKQKYRLLGNSLNVKVVALLIKLLLSEPNRNGLFMISSVKKRS